MAGEHLDHHLVFVSGLLALIIAIAIVFFSPHRAGGAAIAYTVLDQGSQGGVDSRVNYLIASPDQFAELWQMLHGSSTPPAIDFASDQVIAVFAGSEPSAGYAIKVAGVYANAAERLVAVELSVPGAGCPTAPVATSPYELVVLPASENASFTHEDFQIVDSCGR